MLAWPQHALGCAAGSLQQPGLLAAAKLGVLSASLAAGLIALALGRLLLPAKLEPGAAQHADEAEASTLR